MAPSSMSIFEAVQQIVRPSTEFPFHLSDFEKERILEVYAAGINDQITIEQAAHQGLLQTITQLFGKLVPGDAHAQAAVLGQK